MIVPSGILDKVEPPFGAMQDGQHRQIDCAEALGRSALLPSGPEVTERPAGTHKRSRRTVEAWQLREYNGLPLGGGPRGCCHPTAAGHDDAPGQALPLVDFRGRRAVAFLICPLMCEIWAFCYF
jgi:hypothetical protein